MVEIEPIVDMCPDEVKAQQSMLKSLEDILEDGISYKEWLRARANKLCEVETYTKIEDDKKADSESSQRAVDGILADLYRIKADNDEEEDAFMARIRADFEADDTKVVKTSGVVVP